jgi:hypothetical protein
LNFHIVSACDEPLGLEPLGHELEAEWLEAERLSRVDLGLPWRNMMLKKLHLGMLQVSGDIHSVLLSQVWARDFVLRIYHLKDLKTVIRSDYFCKQFLRQYTRIS